MDIFKYLTKRPHDDPKVAGCIVWERCEPDETSRVELIIPNDLYLKPGEGIQKHPCIVRFENNIPDDPNQPDVRIQLCHGIDELFGLMESIIEGEHYEPINSSESDDRISKAVLGIPATNVVEQANQFWAEARARVLAIAKENGLHLELAEHDDEFLYDLYEEGERVPSESEVLEAIREYLSEEV